MRYQDKSTKFPRGGNAGPHHVGGGSWVRQLFMCCGLGLVIALAFGFGSLASQGHEVAIINEMSLSNSKTILERLTVDHMNVKDKSMVQNSNNEDDDVAPEEDEEERDDEPDFVFKKMEIKEKWVKDWSKLSDDDLFQHLQDLSFLDQPVQKDKIGEVEFYFQMPLKAKMRGWTTKFPRAILFLAHACGQSATDWFTNLSQRAPEEEAIVLLARRRGIMVVAMDSADKKNKCWNRADGPRIAKVLQHLEERQPVISSIGPAKFHAKRDHIPLFAFGSSTGAMLISSYLPKAFEDYLAEGGSAVDMALDGIIVENVGARLNPKIPSVFISLPGEDKEHEELDKALGKHKGLAQHIELHRLRMTPTYLHERIKYLTEDQSEQIYKEMILSNLVEPKEGRLTRDPRHSPAMQKILQNMLRRLPAGSEELVMAILRSLMVVWGKHATTRDGVGHALDFLLDHM